MADEIERREAPRVRTAEQARLDVLEMRVEALTLALGACVPDGARLVATLLAAPRSGWKAVLDAYTASRGGQSGGSGI